MASHFDETSKISSTYYNLDNEHLTFLLGWYGNADTINKEADKVYVLYNNTITEMELLFGNEQSGIYESHFEYPSQCQPYAFIVKTRDDFIYRLPEQQEYFYGTAWVELESGVPNKPGIDYAECNENHYYQDWRENYEWIANGGDNITKAEITYIQHDQCQGCSKIDALTTIYNQFISNGLSSAYYQSSMYIDIVCELLRQCI